MGYAKSLLDKAREMGHADAENARRIGVSRSYLCDVHAGRKAMSPEAAALLAELVGADATDALKRQTVENEREPERREALRRALFASWVLGVAASLGGAIDATYQTAAVDSLYIVVPVLALAGVMVLRARSTLRGLRLRGGAVAAVCQG